MQLPRTWPGGNRSYTERSPERYPERCREGPEPNHSRPPPQFNMFEKQLILISLWLWHILTEKVSLLGSCMWFLYAPMSCDCSFALSEKMKLQAGWFKKLSEACKKSSPLWSHCWNCSSALFAGSQSHTDAQPISCNIILEQSPNASIEIVKNL